MLSGDGLHAIDLAALVRRHREAEAVGHADGARDRRPEPLRRLRARRGRPDHGVPGEAVARRRALALGLVRRLLLRARVLDRLPRGRASATGRATCCRRCSPTATGSRPTAPTPTGATSAPSPTCCARTSTASPARSGSRAGAGIDAVGRRRPERPDRGPRRDRARAPAIGADVRIIGPVAIGAGATIGAGAALRDAVVLPASSVVARARSCSAASWATSPRSPDAPAHARHAPPRATRCPRAILRRMLDALLSLILPRSCAGCAAPGPLWCESCVGRARARRRALLHALRRPDALGGRHLSRVPGAGARRSSRPGRRSPIAAAGAVLVRRWKDRGLDLADVAARVIEERRVPPDVDCLCAVPASAARARTPRRRRPDGARARARARAGSCRSGATCSRRARDALPQRGLDRRARRVNLRGVFVATGARAAARRADRRRLHDGRDRRCLRAGAARGRRRARRGARVRAGASRLRSFS